VWYNPNNQAGKEAASMTETTGDEPAVSSSEAPSSEIWCLKDGELTEPLIRALGQMVYVDAFFDPLQSVKHDLYDHPLYWQEPRYRDVVDLPADIYLERYADVRRLDFELVRRWTQATARDMAGAITSHNAYPKVDQQARDAVQRVVDEGVKASMRDQRRLICVAMELKLGSEFVIPQHRVVITPEEYDELFQ
jgi:hypothetical protein